MWWRMRLPSFSSLRRVREAMRFARSILSGAFFLSFGAGGLLLSLVLLLPLPQTWPRKLFRASFCLFVWAGEVTRLFRVELSPADRKAIASLRGAVVVANHPSLIDIVILVSLMGESVCITKAAAGRNPFMRVIVRNVLIVNDGPIEVLERARRALSQGMNVIVFPEGTRTPVDAEKHVFHRGAAQIALRTAAPVETVFISSDPPVLGKVQHWWEVGGRTVVYTVRYRGRIQIPSPKPADSATALHSEAAKLAEQMHERIFAA